jgi:hypothetical protein
MFGCCEKDSAEATVPPVVESAGVSEELTPEVESHFLKTFGWISAALGAVALGVLVGREIRQRYKFNRRTPYDLYAHSGDQLPDVDSGVGI